MNSMNSDEYPDRAQYPWRLRWTGGANLPTSGGSRINASEFFAELAVRDGVVELRLRGRLGRLTRAETLRASRNDLKSVFPIRSRSRLGWLRFRGVGFRRVDDHEYYFKTRRTDEILAALRYGGFPL